MAANLWPSIVYPAEVYPSLWWPFKGAATVSVVPSRSRIYQRELERFKAQAKFYGTFENEKTVIQVDDREVEVVKGGRPSVLIAPNLFDSFKDLIKVYPEQEALRVAQILERRRSLKEVKKGKEILLDLLSNNTEDEELIFILLYSDII